MMKKGILLISIICAAILGCNSSEKRTENHNIEKKEALQHKEEDRQFLVQVGDQSPSFQLEFADQATITSNDLKGKVVMLQFTASWCGVCRKEMPHIEKEIWQKHKNNPNFALFGVDREEPVEKIEVLREATGVTYPIAMDLDASVFTKFAEKEAGITRNILIDKDGKIVMLTRLFEEEEFNRLVQTIDDLLQQK